jgi:hypothetical protein
MIEYKKHKDIDFEKWDHCIDLSLNGIIYPYSFYLNQVSPDWEALIYKDYEAVMPLPVKKKFGMEYIIQPIFVQQLGVFAKIPVSESMLADFIEKIPSKFRYIILNLNTFNPKINLTKTKAKENVTYELDLISSYEIIKNGYSGQIKRNIKKAEKEKVFIVRNDDPMPIIESFRSNRGKNISHIGELQYQTLKHLIYSGIYRGNTEIYSAFTAQNSFCAGIIFFRSHKKSILIFSGSTPEARANGAMSAIIDRYITEHAGQNLTLDFEGSNEKNLARFYAGFGSKECVFLQIEIINLPLILKPITKVYFFLKKIL